MRTTPTADNENSLKINELSDLSGMRFRGGCGFAVIDLLVRLIAEKGC
ncbi:hypothetical protein [Pseudomonas sp. zfem003]|nr:hypothetical protein [Pseudomonas sp. zfem003]